MCLKKIEKDDIINLSKRITKCSQEIDEKDNIIKYHADERVQFLKIIKDLIADNDSYQSRLKIARK